ncbi:MAG: BON domain-containing protein [Rhodanobacteraceae bacterium]
MKTRIAAAVASLLVASMGTAAYAQGAQQTTPQTTPPTSSPYTSNSMQSNQPMNNMSSGRVARQVKQELTSHGVTATNVNVSFSSGTATLSGTVATRADINKAKSAAMRVRGVKHVDTSNLQARAGQMQH